jgi:hypothetical protein
MNINTTASSIGAIRQNGSCRGKSMEAASAECFSRRGGRHEYPPMIPGRPLSIVSCGALFVSYADYNSFRRGDHPTNILRIVGASAFKASTTTSEVATAQSTFRMVTYQGTHT